jgi:hypothetical protein
MAGVAVKYASLVERFFEKTRYDSSGCLLWIGALQSQGYGSFGNGNGSSMLAHRFAWELAHGAIPDDLTVDHLCVTKRCVDAAHMQLVTRSLNASLGAQRLTHCARGHDLTAPGVAQLRPDRKRRCVACARIEARKRSGCMEALAVASARAAYPALFAAAEQPPTGRVIAQPLRAWRAA